MCGSVEWLPERPRELVSGGCDATLLHIDVTRDEILSKQNLGSSPNSSFCVIRS